MPTIPIVDRWLIGRFLKAYLLLTFSAGLLFLIIDLFTNLDSLLRRGLLEALVQRYGTMLPELYFMLSPHLILLSGLWVVVALLRANELVPLLAVGYSTRRLALPMIVTAALLAVVSWADRELLLPSLAHLRRERQLKQLRESVRPVPDSENGVLAARWYQVDAQLLIEPRFVRLSEGGAEALTVIGVRAAYAPEEGGWRFYEGVRIEPDGAGDERVHRFGEEGYVLPCSIRLSDVEAAIDAPTYLSAGQLREQLERNPGFSHLRIQLYERFTQPLAGVVLLLAALPLAFGAAKGSHTYLRILGGLGLAVAFFFAATICYELGAREALGPPLLAATLPLLVFGGLGLAMFWRGE